MSRYNTRALRTRIETINSALERAERQLETNYQRGIFGKDVRAVELAQQVSMLEEAAAQAAREALRFGDEKLAALASMHSTPAYNVLAEYRMDKRIPPGYPFNTGMKAPSVKRNPLSKHDPPPSEASRRQGRTLLALSGFFG